MTKRFIMRPFLPVALLCCPAFITAQTPDAPKVQVTAPVLTPEQTASIMKQLDEIESKITKGRGDVLGTALTKFRAAMASENDALALYLDCYRVEHYERRDLKQSDFQDWKKANEDRLKDDEFLKGLLLQLEYLALTIQAQNVTDTKDTGPLVTALQAFLPKAIGAVQGTMKRSASGTVEDKDKGGNRGNGGRGNRGGTGSQLAGMLRQSVQGTEFSKAFKLDDHLKKGDWDYTPLNVAGIYNSVIFPYYLSEKPADLPAQWDARISAELALRKVSQSDSEYAIYYAERYPKLLWEKASYLLQNNINPVLALADMLKVVRDNPNHPDAGGWLKEIRQLVTQGQPTPASSPGATPAPAAGAGTN